MYSVPVAAMIGPPSPRQRTMTRVRITLSAKPTPMASDVSTTWSTSPSASWPPLRRRNSSTQPSPAGAVATRSAVAGGRSAASDGRAVSRMYAAIWSTVITPR